RDKATSWAVQQADRWYPNLRSRPLPSAAVLHAADVGEPGASQRLLDLVADPAQPAIVRASALGRLGSDMAPRELERVTQALSDRDALVRRAAVEALAETDPMLRLKSLPPMLDDPVR